MAFIRTPYDQWERKEYLEFFQNSSIYITEQLDMTKLYCHIKQKGLRLYPSLVYCAAKVVNQYPEFRYAYDEQHCVGIWEELHPYYTVPRVDNPTLFSMKYSAYSPDFLTFYHTFEQDYKVAEHCGRLLCDETMPKNIFGVSIAPGVPFTGFCFGGEPKEDFVPFVLFGKLTHQGDRFLLPVGAEFSHAVNDGQHISRFFEQLKETADNLL